MSRDCSRKNEAEFAYFGRDLEVMTFAHNYHRWIVDEFAPFLKGSIAEVGAGTGDVTAMLLECPEVTVTAFEPSSNMYAVLARRFASNPRIRLYNGFFRQCRDASSGKGFDSIAYINVLEHIENDRRELSRAWQAMRSGGYLLIFVPALRFLYSEFDRKIGHYRRYHRRSLESLIEEVGFKVIISRYFDILGVLPWYVIFRLLRRSLSVGSVSLYDKLAIPMMRIIESMFSPPFGKNLLLVAKKPDACQKSMETRIPNTEIPTMSTNFHAESNYS